MTENPVFARIEADVKSNDIVLYMKGSKKLPQCGFSATVAAVFERLGITVTMRVVDDARQGVSPMRTRTLSTFTRNGSIGPRAVNAPTSRFGSGCSNPGAFSW